MAPLTKDRMTPERSGDGFVFPVGEGVRIFAGALVVLEDGFAKPGFAEEDLTAVGRAEAQIDNRLGEDGDAHVRVRPGVYRFAQGGDLIDLSDVGSDAFILDDQTVVKGEGEGLSKAGRIMDVDAQGVWVKIG